MDRYLLLAVWGEEKAAGAAAAGPARGPEASRVEGSGKPLGRAMIDIILLPSDKDPPKLRDCLPTVGALKHLKEWYSAKITVVGDHCEISYQKIAEYLSANVVSFEDLRNAIDSKELWRGKIQICERKVFHYYGPALEFVQMIKLSDLPSCYMSDIEFELGLTKNSAKQSSVLLLEQISSLCGEAGALFVLPCTISSILIPPPSQLSSRRWKEYMARKPRTISVPDVEVKGESSSYYLLLQGNGNGECRATLIHSANQINGSFALSLIHGKMKATTEETKLSFPLDLLSLPSFSREQLIQREKQLDIVQALALKECLKSRSLEPPSCPVETSPLQWPERHVLQNLETFEKAKQKMRTGSLPRSSEQLLGHKEGPRDSVTLLDAKELLKFFTSDGLPIGDLQPLQIQKGEKTFVLTPELSPRKLRGLPFEKASVCHYHGIEYCLDDRKALERDGGFSELQSRLIRYETRTTCTRGSSPGPTVLSPLPSPAVLSEPTSVPDGEALQGELRTDVSRVKRRSQDLNCLYPRKRLVRSGSSDSLLSQTSGSARHHHEVPSRKPRAERPLAVTCPSALSSEIPGVTAKARSGQKAVRGSETARPAKESRSQKHTRDLKTSRGLFEEMKKTTNNNVVQVNVPVKVHSVKLLFCFRVARRL
ncbi:hypothetical protein G4228_014151 [Cervus hanglu yarkandensis]|nr:hypothetical protein G4228_014151 [Cervus hanglu yarkandensis]